MAGPAHERRGDPVRRGRFGDHRGRRGHRLRHRPAAARTEEKPGRHGGAAVWASQHVPANYKPYITVSTSLSNRCVALATLDAALYEELAAELRLREISSVSVVPGQRLPAQVAVVLTSPAEAGQLSHPRTLVVTADSDRTALWAAVEHALHPEETSGEIVVGIDPGPRPGYAVVAGRRCLARGILESPEEAARLGSHLRHRFPSRELVFRVGSQDRVARDRILNALAPLRRPIELVNESGTTPRGHRRPRDAIAAQAIALGRGRPVKGSSPISITPGDVANLQRLSREGSGGQFTIPRSEAGRVLRGELTLSEALAQGARRYQGASAGASRRRGPPEPS